MSDHPIYPVPTTYTAEDLSSPGGLLSLIASVAHTAGRPVDWSSVDYKYAGELAARLMSVLWPLAYSACGRCGIGIVRDHGGVWHHAWSDGGEAHDPEVPGLVEHRVKEVLTSAGYYALHCTCGWGATVDSSRLAESVAAQHMKDAGR